MGFSLRALKDCWHEYLPKEEICKDNTFINSHYVYSFIHNAKYEAYKLYNYKIDNNIINNNSNENKLDKNWHIILPTNLIISTIENNLIKIDSKIRLKIKQD